MLLLTYYKSFDYVACINITKCEIVIISRETEE